MKVQWYSSALIVEPLLPGAIDAGSRVYRINAHTADLKDREVNTMGDVLITYQIMPTGVDVDIEQMKDEIKQKIHGVGEINDFREEPIAFGLKALIVRVIVKDEGGVSDKIEEMLRSINNVQGIVVNEVTLI